ncbi:BRCT domain-containing protein [Halomonas sp. M4R1S46]|uniref:BRCT domain-containing protein n=1 Tax=Halomonas sp. M4R1S46 TaxID=2982692 RepID=UPI0021E444DA|nr:BRCT domain-containing protein [Halomonas sp. M4R1S46]UYG08394.1 BRCT domain-containing protein [Halomonas sp. M4R1S46]
MPIQLDHHGQPVTRRLSMARNTTRDANELCGLARGMLADGSVNQAEAEYLLQWLGERPEALAVWPFNVLFPRLEEMLGDGVLDAEEEGELIGLLLDYTGGGSTQGGSSSSRQSTALPLCDPVPDVVFEGSNFVLTGRFVTGTRRECEAEIVQRGGQPQKSPSRATHFVVIGNLGSDDWAQSNYGRKIQHAVELRRDGRDIHLISERHWANWL